MGNGQCPGDMVSRVVRCCDIIFALLDQGRRSERRNAGQSLPPWRPDIDPANTADDFLPVLIYVVLRANVPRLHSMCEYVQAFHSPVALMSRWVLPIVELELMGFNLSNVSMISCCRNIPQYFICISRSCSVLVMLHDIPPCFIASIHSLPSTLVKVKLALAWRCAQCNLP